MTATIITGETRNDARLGALLAGVRRIAMVGCSPNPSRPSHRVMRYLQDLGYTVVPVNPGHAGDRINGETVHADLGTVPGPIDMVDIFRRSDAAGAIVDQAVGLAPDKGIRLIWMQLGVQDDAAAERARAAGLSVIMNRCPKIEYARLFGDVALADLDPVA